MQAATRTEQELLETLQKNIDGAIVVTNTVRAARSLRQRYNQRQHASGNAGWMTPRILAWEPWLSTLWDAGVLCGTETRVLLTNVQELELWQRVLAQDEVAGKTFSAPALAELAQRSWHQMHQYRISPGQLRGDSSVDTNAFYRWATEFENVCRKSSFLSPSLVEAAIAQWIPTQEMALPENIFLVGFDRVTPAQARLIDALNARGCSTDFLELRPANTSLSNPAIVSARTGEEEIASAAHWIRRILLKDPTQRIGVIVPSLEELMGPIDATFRRVLAPSTMDVRAKHTLVPYEFSLGIPMHRLQPIRTALSLLQWLEGAIPSEDVSWLLVHGGFNAGQDGSRDARARLDRRFREREFQLGGPVSLPTFLQWLSQSGSREEISAFREVLNRLSIAAQRHRLEKLRSFAEWREIIEDLLAAAEWRLLAASGSADYQLLQRWNALLNDLSSLNGVSGPLRFPAVLDKLEHLAAHTLFTLEGGDAPVQILGISESAGLVFDSVWWMHAKASEWPARGKAQPFLPWNLQRETHMPYADPTEDYAFALRTTKRILASGKTVVVSFALQDSDAANASAHMPDREIVLAPLIREVLPNTPMSIAEEFVPECFQVQPTRNSSQLETNLEHIEQEAAVPFQGTEVRGGVRFLELHAACPFRAFAELRLGTRPLAELDTGLSPGVQGTVIHRVLDQFWRETKSRKNLLASTVEQLEENLRGHIRRALEEFFQHATEPWQKTLLDIEAERLEQRLMAWLETDKQRTDFTVIGTEASLDNPQLAGIKMQCRVDRIDQVEQGIVLLDYKMGVVDRNSCEGDRPDQPQLPAYAVLRKPALGTQSALAGVAFAGLHPRKVGFTVVRSLPSIFSMPSKSPEAAGAEADVVPEARSTSRWNPTALTPEEMQSQMEIWSASLTRLAEEFRAGAAIVDPKKHEETCKYCAQALICRIGEAAGAIESTIGEEDRESNS